jgi:hypothetical protein
VVEGFDTSSSRVFVADAVLDTKGNMNDGTLAASVMVGCLDFAPGFAHRLSLSLSPVEMACFRRTIRSSNLVRDMFAGKFNGTPIPPAVKRGMGTEFVQCLTAVHRHQTADRIDVLSA